jgi:hypothetical protein
VFSICIANISLFFLIFQPVTAVSGRCALDVTRDGWQRLETVWATTTTTMLTAAVRVLQWWQLWSNIPVSTNYNSQHLNIHTTIVLLLLLLLFRLANPVIWHIDTQALGCNRDRAKTVKKIFKNSHYKTYPFWFWSNLVFLKTQQSWFWSKSPCSP